MHNKPIGIFDSGIGGTSIWKEIVSFLPHENTIYLADSKNAPYGKRSKDEIISLSIKNTNKLLALNCKTIVVACNTATTNAVKVLRSMYTTPIIGIEPAIKPAAIATKTRKVGILATKGTLSSALFNTTSSLYAQNIEVIEIIGAGLVELIEAGKIDSNEMRRLLHTYISPMIEQNIDHLVLGCTHYPYLIPELKRILPKNITIIDSGKAVARHTKTILANDQLLNTRSEMGEHLLYTNGDINALKSVVNPKNYKTTKIETLDF